MGNIPCPPSGSAVDVVCCGGHGVGDEDNNATHHIISNGPISIHGLCIPTEILVRVLEYCSDDRSAVNNLSLTCRGAYRAIHDLAGTTRAAMIPWPDHCPWPKEHWNSRFFVASKDMSRFAVIREANDGRSGSKVEVWDRYNGLIGELVSRRERFWLGANAEDHRANPAFSPDGQFLLLPMDIHRNSFQSVWIPSGTKAAAVNNKRSGAMFVSSEHFFPGKVVTSLGFVNNETIAMVVECTNGDDDDVNENVCIVLRKIEQVNGHIRLSRPRTILQDQVDRSTHKFTSFVSEGKTFLVTHCGENRIIIYDLESDETVVLNAPPVEGYITDLVFTRNGELLICTSRGLLVFDLKVNEFGPVGFLPLIISRGGRQAHQPCLFSEITSLSSDGTRVAVRFGSTDQSLLYDLRALDRFLDISDTAGLFVQLGWMASCNGTLNDAEQDFIFNSEVIKLEWERARAGRELDDDGDEDEDDFEGMPPLLPPPLLPNDNDNDEDGM